MWKVARESHDVAELGRRIRQTGASRLAFNFMTANWIAMQYSSFPWDSRSIRLYADYCKSRLVLEGRTATMDCHNGGFAFYRILSRPLSRPPAEIWWAPGLEAIYGPIDNRIREGTSIREALGGFVAIQAALPDVGITSNKIGHILMLMGDSANALIYLEKFGLAGMIDDNNMLDLGTAAIMAGKLELAERALDRALAAYPDSRYMVLLNQASLDLQFAIRELGHGRIDQAAARVDKGLAAIGGVPETGIPIDTSKILIVKAFLHGLQGKLAIKPAGPVSAAGYADRGLAEIDRVPDDPGLPDASSRRITHAFLLAVRAEVAQASGDRATAGRLYGEAARMNPGDPRAREWAALAAKGKRGDIVY
jgi:tetratricopeptide (TPR) repeat protein